MRERDDDSGFFWRDDTPEPATDGGSEDPSPGSTPAHASTEGATPSPGSTPAHASADPGDPSSGRASADPGDPSSGSTAAGASAEPGVPSPGSTPARGSGSGEPGTGGPTAKRKAVRLLTGLAVSAALLGTVAYLVVKPRLVPEDFEGAGTGSVTVHIPAGATASQVGETLAGAGVVASARSFTNVTMERGKAGSLRPGHFQLRRGMAAEAALDLLLAPVSRVVKKVTVPEGLRLTEVFALAAKATGFPLADFRSAEVSTPYGKGLEGLLFPATYEVEPGQTAADLLKAMVARFAQAAEQLGVAEGAERLGLEPLQLVTVASIVQAEGGRDADYPKIARVIYNRLRNGTPLQLDTTVLYAQRRHTLRVLESDTRVRSPYNTYLRPGLPPGPISNPGEKALQAALRPAEGDWLWFVTTDPQRRITKFTDKESEFVRYREELNEKLGMN
ncbi:endolytic transglycosylase MltG [Nonomuraea sp. NPDC050310]|uniref:endolytic transglycosylase MltG n=1 Tax=Nonomuraea sp. NPDC050310 TaxID=3154935 RepID=UPI0033D787F8